MKRFYRIIALNGRKEITQSSDVKEWSFRFSKMIFLFTVILGKWKVSKMKKPSYGEERFSQVQCLK